MPLIQREDGSLEMTPRGGQHFEEGQPARIVIKEGRAACSRCGGDIQATTTREHVYTFGEVNEDGTVVMRYAADQNDAESDPDFSCTSCGELLDGIGIDYELD